MPKIVVIIVAVFVLLLGGAAAVMNQMQIGPFAPDTAGGPQETVAAEDRPPDPPKFIAMETLVVPLFKGDRTNGTVLIQVQLETSPKNEDKIKKLLPRLKDVYLRDLNGYLPRLIRDKKEVDVNLVKQRMKIIGDRAIGNGLLEGVLIQSILTLPAR